MSMLLKINKEGWLNDVPHMPSPNCNVRPDDTTISLLVIHNISLPPGDFTGKDVEAFFLNQLDVDKHPYYQKIKDIKVSSHVFIRRDGSIIQFVPFHLRAWHAGESSFEGVSNCNDYSIGVELEGTDDQSFADAQYRALAELTQCICKQYPGISLNRIVGHSDIAPGRKTDPGACFDWQRFKDSL